MLAILDMNDTYFVDLNTLNGLYKNGGLNSRGGKIEALSWYNCRLQY